VVQAPAPAPKPPRAAPKPKSTPALARPPAPKAKPKPRPVVAAPSPPRRTGVEPPPLAPRAAKAPPSPARPLALAPKTKPEPAPIARPVPRPGPAAAAAATVTPTRATRREGRALLRLLEYGKGPVIEIAWPDVADSRERLYRRFRDCFGMRNAVMTPDGKLFGESGPPGVAWVLNLDRYSGFVRRPEGRAIAAERARARAISARHGVDGRLVRIFPRNVDAVILGGLRQVIGGAYREARTVTATYRRRGGRLVLDAIRINGRPLTGAVDVTAVGRPGCRV
jgi:hypothetical protein